MMHPLSLLCSLLLGSLLMTNGYAVARTGSPSARHPKNPFDGPLRVHTENPRYFTDRSGSVVYLTGSHTCEVFQDNPADGSAEFDFDKFLLFLQENNHNFLRLWIWESPGRSAVEPLSERFSPMPYLQTGPGFTLDGCPKYDLTQFNPEFFTRLRNRVEAAYQSGIYVGIQLFQGYSVAEKADTTGGNPWHAHPYHKSNNINGIDGDPDNDDNGYETHTLRVSEITALQEAYVKKVIETVGDFENVLFEISNESHGASMEWQNHMAELIKTTEKSRKWQHPVWISYAFDPVQGSCSNQQLFESPADVISPGPDGAFRNDLALATGEKVILLDSDHLDQIENDALWVWKSFTRGHNPIYRDCYLQRSENGAMIVTSAFKPIRRALGDTRRYATRMDLAGMVPVDDTVTSSTRYCLAKPGNEYLFFQPDTTPFSIKAEEAKYRVEWYNPVTGITKRNGSIRLKSGRYQVSPPWKGSAILYLKKRGRS